MPAKNGHKAGVQLPKRTATLIFEGDYEGVEIKVRLGVSLRRFLGLQRMFNSEDPDQIEKSLEEFSERILLSWNVLDDDGNPLPPSLVDVEDLIFAREIISKYMEAVPDVPLATASSGA